MGVSDLETKSSHKHSTEGISFMINVVRVPEASLPGPIPGASRSFQETPRGIPGASQRPSRA